MTKVESGIDNGAGVLRVEVFDQLHRPLDVGEYHSDGLALALKVFRGGRASYSNLRLVGFFCGRGRCSEGRAALAAKFFAGLSRSATSRALGSKRRTALGAEFPPFSILSSALRAAHGGFSVPLARKTLQTKLVSARTAKARFEDAKAADVGLVSRFHRLVTHFVGNKA